MQFYSEDGQDKFIIEKVFNYKRGGVFVDVGAYDGVILSNSIAMERDLGWTGVCLEPNPSIYNELKQNRTCKCVNYCISGRDGLMKFMSVQGWGVMLSGLVDMFDERHLQRIDNTIEEHGGSKEIVEIPSLPLKMIFEQCGLKEIDYCNIDVEGGEMTVLKSIDFSKVDIKVFTIENNYGSKAIRKFLRPYGYSLINILGADEVYEKNSRRYRAMLRLKIKLMNNYFAELKQDVKKRLSVA